MKKVVLLIAMCLTCLGAFSQEKTDTLKIKKAAVVNIGDKPGGKKSLFRFDKNKVRNVQMQLSAADIYLLSLDKYEWYELDHSTDPKVTPALVTSYHERYEELQKEFKSIGNELYEHDLRQFRSDTTTVKTLVKK